MDRKTIRHLLGYGSLLYIALIVGSMVLSFQLPSWRERGEKECYWDAIDLLVVCGPDLPMYDALEVFYNFWTWFLVAPLGVLFLSPWAVAFTVLLYTPVGYGVYRLHKRLARGRSKTG